MEEKWDKLKKIDIDINKAKDKNFEAFVTPTSVFVTFENEEGVNRAKNFDAGVETEPERLKHLRQLMPRSSESGVEDGTYFEIGEGRDIEIKEASEPSDIIWENREVTKWQRTKAVIV